MVRTRSVHVFVVLTLLLSSLLFTMPLAATGPDPASDVAGGYSGGATQPGQNVALSASLNPDVVLYDNGPLVTHPGGGAGGADASAVQTAIGGTLYGSNQSFSLGYRIADDFAVPAGGWTIDTVTLYAYQTGSGTTSTMNHVNLRIWNGPPNNPGSVVVFGDTTTNRMASTAFSNIYRVLDTGLTNTQRPIMAQVVTVGTTLPEGTYWLDWQTGGTLASGPWQPPVTIVGQLGKPGANALQWVTTGAWQAMLDGVTPQDAPFVIQGTAVAGPAIALTKTVGTVPGVCATTDNITVPGGSDVYYCYQVQNTGTVTFNFHDLVDSELGTLYNNFPLALAPGATSPPLIVPQTVNLSVTNVATWTAVTSIGGYTYNPSINYNWQDISGTGTAVSLPDDGMSAALPIGFSFDFYGTGYTDVYASSNGFLTFLAGQYNGCCSGSPIPTAGDPDGLVVGWWEDMNPSAGGTNHYQTLGSAPNRVFIYQSTNVPHYGGGNLVTLQYKLYEGTNVIEVHYQAAPSDGGSHSAGIENQDGTVGIQHYFGTAPLTAMSAVQYAPGTVESATSTDSATVTVVWPNIFVDPLSLSSSQQAGTTVMQTLTISNTGLADLIWNIVEVPGFVPAQRTTPSRGAAAESYKGAVGGPAVPGQNVPLSTLFDPDAVLYDNGPLVTHPGGGAGGADASALQTALGMTIYGFGHQLSAGNRVADDFTITDPGGWQVDTITFFAYQTGSGTTSSINHVNLQIWDGPPNDPGSSVVFGDTTTNRLASTTFTNIYRVLDTGLTNADRPIMFVVATIGTALPAGTYWVDWQVGGTLASGPWVPPVTVLGSTGTGNSMQSISGAWAPLLDVGPQDLPFVVEGNLGSCAPGDLTWLSVSPTNGTTAPGLATDVTVTFNSTGLATGTYTGTLCIFSNDPDVGPGNQTELVMVPVELIVEPPTAVTISNLTAAAGSALPLVAIPVALLAVSAALWLRRKR